MRRRNPRKSKSRAPEETRDVEISTIGARGDGVSYGPDGPIYVPGTAPGDHVEVRIGASKGDGRAGRVTRLIAAGPDRVEPPCRHAAACGGCVVQHLSDPAVARFKRGVVMDALSKKALSIDQVRDTRTVPPATRRRLNLAARRTANGAVLGFNERGGSQIIDLAECKIATPALEALFKPIRALVADLDCVRAADILVTETDTGVDALIAPSDGASPGLREREALAEFAETHDLARLAWRADGFLEPLAARRAPAVSFGGVSVEIPIGAFLQPSLVGQGLLMALIAEGLPPTVRRVADLYSGCGAFTLPLAAKGMTVFAAEGEAAAVRALRRAGAGLSMTAEVRDLARAPVAVESLNTFDAVIFDPPRAGAAPQAEQLAGSSVECVVAVSCNPATLARDLRVLIDGGYTLEAVTPVDQFTWSAHVEAVAILRRL